MEEFESHHIAAMEKLLQKAFELHKESIRGKLFIFHVCIFQKSYVKLPHVQPRHRLWPLQYLDNTPYYESCDVHWFSIIPLYFNLTNYEK